MMRRGWWGLGLAALLGCEPLDARSLDDLEFSEGARLDTHADIAFAVDGDADAVLWVRLADGTTLYTGPASLATRRPLRLRAPAGTAVLAVTLRDPDGVTEVREVPVHDALARLTLGGAR